MPALSQVNVPPYMLSGFTGAPDTLRAMVQAVQGLRGEQSMLVRSVAEHIVRRVQPKDYLGEILAIRYWVTENVRYVNDPLHVEMVKDPERLIEEIRDHGIGIGDCDDLCAIIGCMALQVGRVAEAVVVGFGAPGEFAHVFCRVQEPRSGQWIVCDPVAGTDERGMLESVTDHFTVSFDEYPERIAA